jgi:hypothetical protein
MRSVLFVAMLITLLAGGAGVAGAQSANWVQLSTAHSPSGRYYPAMAYDPVSRLLLLFGGMTASGTVNDTWLFDGSDWAQVQTPTAPGSRYGAAMQFDRVIKKMVLFGGTNSAHTFLSDTWLWDGASRTWTQATPAHHPPALLGAAAFTDPSGGHVSIFGGQLSSGGDVSTTYRWMGTDWKQLIPASSPTQRAFPALALDHDRNIVVLFGGLASQNTDNTWTWNGTTWTLQNPANQPPFTYFSAAAYDRALKQVVVFGGIANGFNHDITWGWDSAEWQDLAPPTRPSARSKMALALDTALNRVILFGGTPTIGQFLDDTWELEP